MLNGPQAPDRAKAIRHFEELFWAWGVVFEQLEDTEMVVNMRQRLFTHLVFLSKQEQEDLILEANSGRIRDRRNLQTDQDWETFGRTLKMLKEGG